MGGFSKTLVSGDAGSIVVTESGGVASLSISIGGSLGGGSAAGIATVKGSVTAYVSAKQLIDLGLGLAASEFPSVAALINEAQALIDAEIAAN